MYMEGVPHANLVRPLHPCIPAVRLCVLAVRLQSPALSLQLFM